MADPDSAPPTTQDQLRNLYRLTPAEAAVAMAITRGAGLQAVADELEVSLTTALQQRAVRRATMDDGR